MFYRNPQHPRASLIRPMDLYHYHPRRPGSLDWYNFYKQYRMPLHSYNSIVQQRMQNRGRRQMQNRKKKSEFFREAYNNWVEKRVCSRDPYAIVEWIQEQWKKYPGGRPVFGVGKNWALSRNIFAKKLLNKMLIKNFNEKRLRNERNRREENAREQMLEEMYMQMLEEKYRPGGEGFLEAQESFQKYAKILNNKAKLVTPRPIPNKFNSNIRQVSRPAATIHPTGIKVTGAKQDLQAKVNRINNSQMIFPRPSRPWLGEYFFRRRGKPRKSNNSNNNSKSNNNSNSNSKSKNNRVLKI